MPQMFTVQYEVGPYKGTRQVRANNSQEAKDIVKRFITHGVSISINLAEHKQTYTVLGEADPDTDQAGLEPWEIQALKKTDQS